MNYGLEANLTDTQQSILAEQEGQSSYTLRDLGRGLIRYGLMPTLIASQVACAGYTTKINNVDVQDPTANMRAANTPAPETKGWYCKEHPWICVGIGVAVIAGGAAALGGGGGGSSSTPSAPSTPPGTPPSGGGSDPNGPGSGGSI